MDPDLKIYIALLVTMPVVAGFMTMMMTIGEQFDDFLETILFWVVISVFLITLMSVIVGLGFLWAWAI